MRSIRMIGLAAVAAFAAAVFVAPAAASAAVYWTNGGAPLEEAEGIGLSGGSIEFGVINDRIQCSTSGEATLDANSNTGEITSFEIDECETYGFTLEHCVVESAPSATPFPIEARATDEVLVEDFAFAVNFADAPFKSCPFTQWNVQTYEGTEMLAIPGYDESGFLQSLDLVGTVEWQIGSSQFTSGLTANPLTVTPAETYGIYEY